MLGSRRIRAFAAISLCTAVAMLLWPRATGHVSTFAVVNAPVLTVRAPINGVVLQPTPGLSAPVMRDDVLFDLAATQTSRSELARLDADITALGAEAAALLEEELEVRAILSALQERAVEETETELIFLTRKLEEARADRLLNEIAWDRASTELARLRTLVGSGLVPRQTLDAAGFALRAAEAELAADDATVAALIVEIDAIERGLPSPAGTGRRDFAYDRLDDIALALADVRTRRIAAEARRDAAARQLAEIQNDFNGLSRFRPEASTNGVIWTASRQAGASVTEGSDLYQVLDCDRRFIEVIFQERAFEDLPPGTEATVCLRGADAPFEATVVSRHAAGRGAAVSAVDAAVLEPYETGGVKVFLRMAPADLTDPRAAAAFCDVGRTAEVRIRHPSYDRFLSRVQRTLASLRGFGADRVTELQRVGAAYLPDPER